MTRSLALSVLAVLASSGAAWAQPAINWYTIDGGGGTSTGTNGSTTFSLSGTIGQHDAGPAAGPMTGTNGTVTFSLVGGFWPGAGTGPACPIDYNRDTFVNLDDLGDFITDYYFQPAIPGGSQAFAPTYPSMVVGYGVPCPSAPDAPAPYAVDAYRAAGYRVGFSLDGSNSCPLAPDAPYPNLDNLGDYITAFYSNAC
jgi:hypothetical protein